MLKHTASKNSIFQQRNKSEFLSQMISLSEKGIEYVGTINRKGRLEEIFCKQNDIDMTDERKEMFFMTLQLHKSMNSDFDDEFGRVDHILVERQNSRFVLIYIDEEIILIKLNKMVNPMFILNKIPKILSSYKKFQEYDGINLEYL